MLRCVWLRIARFSGVIPVRRQLRFVDVFIPTRPFATAAGFSLLGAPSRFYEY